MGLFSALGFTATDAQKKADRAVGQTTEFEKARRAAFDEEAAGTRRRFLGELDEFDPTAFMETAARGVGAELNEDLGETVAANNRALNRRGFFGSRLNTGAISRDFNDRLSRALAQQAFSAAGLELDRVGMLGDQAGADVRRADVSRDRELELIHGTRDAEQAKRNSRLGGTIGLASLGARYFGGGGG